MRIAVQMDPIETINIKGDSTFALMLEAQSRGYALSYYTPNDLFYHNGKVQAHLQAVRIRDEVGNHFDKADCETHLLSEYDVVLLRQDPPFDMNYLTTTYLLEQIGGKTLVVNNPTHVRNSPEKLLVMLFPDLLPKTLITRSKSDILSFREEIGDVVMKPLYGNGGAGVFRVRPDDENFGSLYDMFLTSFPEPFIVQEFLPQVYEGDKRIILVDGEYAGALNRVPAKGDIRSNMVRGGAAELSDLTEQERHICETIKPVLQERGLLFTGIDVIGDKLTEINVTSPTGLRPIKNLGGADIAALIWDKIEDKVHKSSK